MPVSVIVSVSNMSVAVQRLFSSRLLIIDAGFHFAISLAEQFLLFSHNACHQSDNSQLKSVLQTVLITYNGFAGCPSFSVLCQINGITSYSPRNMEAIKASG